MDWVELLKNFGLPLAMLIVVGSVFLRMVDRQQQENSELNKWIRDEFTKALRDFNANCDELLDRKKHA